MIDADDDDEGGRMIELANDNEELNPIIVELETEVEMKPNDMIPFESVAVEPVDAAAAAAAEEVGLFLAVTIVHSSLLSFNVPWCRGVN